FQSGRAGGQFQVTAGGTVEVQDLAFSVDQQRGRGVLLEQRLLGDLGQSGRSIGSPFRRRPELRATLFVGHNGKINARVPRLADPPMNLPLLGDRLEEVLVKANALGRPQKQVASGLEAEVKQRNDLFLHVGLEVNEQIAATDQIQLGERG